MWLDQWRPKYAELFITGLVVTIMTKQVKPQPSPSLVVPPAHVLLSHNLVPLAVVTVQEVAISKLPASIRT